MGDVGTHVWHLDEYVAGLEVIEMCVEHHTFVDGRPVDDDGAAFLKFEDNVAGVLMAT